MWPSYGDIASIITALAAIGALAMSLRNGRKIQEVHLSINSRMDQLLEATAIASRATGRDQAHADMMATRSDPGPKPELK